MQAPERAINIGLIGLGNIGKGVARYFQEGKGKPFNVHLRQIAVADLSKPREVQFPNLTNNPNDIVGNPDIDIVVELMGGTDPAGDYIRAALHEGHSVVTANKAVMSRRMKELFDYANSNSVNIGFEAAVGGGIRIIKTLLDFRGERIDRIVGIVNGTTNYILTQMDDDLDFETALRGAQERGFAEANHVLDTGGFDARDKLAVLASLAFNTQVDIEQISCRGITEITPADIDFARETGYAIKLLAMAERRDGEVEARVTPALISKEHPLASVRDAFNEIYIEGNLAGPQTFWGRGAGEEPTTSAVISDILRIADNIRKSKYDELPKLDSQVAYADPGDTKQRGYIRATLKHVPGTLSRVTGLLGKHGLNIENAIQRKAFGIYIKGKPYLPDIITFESAPKRRIDAALHEIKRLRGVYGTPFFLPIVE